MSLTYLQARDEIYTAIKTAWGARPMAWPDVPDAALPPKTATAWARTSLKHVTGHQSALTGANSQKKFTREGVLTIQVFAPRGDGLSSAYALAKILSDALEGQATPAGVWYRNVRIAEAGGDGIFSQLNVLADFSYDEVK